MKRKTAGQEDFFLNFGNVDVSRLDEPAFGDYVKSRLRYGVSQGIRGLKFWKPIGLGIKDGSGKYITPDDERPVSYTHLVCGIATFLRTYYEAEKLARLIVDKAPQAWVLNFANLSLIHI